jgi:hypothetical protein
MGEYLKPLRFGIINHKLNCEANSQSLPSAIFIARGTALGELNRPGGDRCQASDRFTRYLSHKLGASDSLRLSEYSGGFGS